MNRRLPHEPELLIAKLTSWIDWRYAGTTTRLVLTSAPTSIPPPIERWMPAAVWRLAWQENATAVLYGLAPGAGPRHYFVVRYDGIDPHREGVFAEHGDGKWVPVEGDRLDFQSSLESRLLVRFPQIAYA